MSLTALFYTLTQTMNFARDSEMRIQAVALAREGIEAVYNIRNTNWLRFPSRRESCWNVLNYNSECMSGNGWQQAMGGRYFLKNENGLWELWTPSPINSNNFIPLSTAGFGLDIDRNGNYVPRSLDAADPANWCSNIQSNRIGVITINCRSPFARIIDITAGTNTLDITSTVYFRSSSVKKVELKATITNWKSNYQ